MTDMQASDIATAMQAQSDIVDDFAFFDDWTDRYRHIIDLGKQLPELDESEKNDTNRVFGCQSMVWFVIEQDNDQRMAFRATSDAMIVRGLIALLSRVYNGRLASTVRDVEPDFINQLGLEQHLSPTRNNGLLSMVKKLKEAANS